MERLYRRKDRSSAPSDLGVLSILSFLAPTVSLLTSLALQTAMTKYMAENVQNKPETAAAVQKTVITSVLIFSAIGFAMIAYFSETLSQYFWNNTIYAPLILFMCIYAFLSGLTSLYNPKRLYGSQPQHPW